MAHIFLFWWGGAGLAILVNGNDKFLKFVKYFAVLTLALQLGLNYQKENQWGNRHFAEFGRNMVKNLPKNSMLFILSDLNTNTVRYVQACEDYRLDVEVMDRIPFSMIDPYSLAMDRPDL